jgi:hypothetical protein
MNDEDLRDFFAAFAMLGGVVRNGAMHKYIADDAYAMADHMLAARHAKEVGIAAVKKRVKKPEENT